jgi:hypothetical protein
VAGRDLVRIDEAALDQHSLEAEKPALVIGAGEIDLRREQLACVTRRIDVPETGRAHGPVHRQHAAFPAFVKHRLVRLGIDFAEAVHATHVVDAIHQATSLGVLGRPVPIMQSRVTSEASLSSLQPSAPAGRIGTTR